VLQFGHVIARSHVPRGASAASLFASIVVGGFSTFFGAPRSSATNAAGGNVPRGKCFMILPDTTTL
jgi:hypothetical protein